MFDEQLFHSRMTSRVGYRAGRIDPVQTSYELGKIKHKIDHSFAIIDSLLSSLLSNLTTPSIKNGLIIGISNPSSCPKAQRTSGPQPTPKDSPITPTPEQ
jgi:hypothetical protein